MCAVKPDNKSSGVNVQGCSSFPIKLELTKLLLKLAIDDSTHMFSLSSQKSLGEHFLTIMSIADEFERNFLSLASP